MSAVQQGSAFAVEREAVEGIEVLAVRGELDVSTVPQLRDHLQAAQERGVERVVIDLAGVTFVDSVSLAALLKFARATKRFALVVPPGSFGMLIFEASGMESVLPIFATRDLALDHARA